MKQLASILVLGSLLAIAAAAPAIDPTSNEVKPLDKSHPAQVPGGSTDTGGETPATATVIAALPFADSDNTCGHTQDYFASCGGNNAPDLFYRYVPSRNMEACISTCGSTYDTILYVLENNVEIACNDDSCGLQSELRFTMRAGLTYIIGVSGFSTACGAYTLRSCPPPSCPYICPPGSQLEGEPRCADNYVDNYNGGCNSTPTVFQDVRCGYVCGETGTFLNSGQQFRDTDWYRLTVGAGAFQYNGMAEGFPIARYVLTPVCPPSLLAGPGVNCGPLAFTGPGSFYFFAGTTGFTGVPCGTRYWLTWEGPGIPPCGVTAVEPTTWGNIKNVYR